MVVFGNTQAHYPKSKAQCISALKDLSATPGNIFRNMTDDIIMVAHADDLRLIPAEGAELYADGTFQYAPWFFKQMYSNIEGWILLHYCAFFITE